MITPSKIWPQAKRLFTSHHWLRRVTFFCLGMVVTSIAIGVSYWGWEHHYTGRVLPNLTINDELVGGLTEDEVKVVVHRQTEIFQGHWPLVFSWREKRFSVPFAAEAIVFDEAGTVKQALLYGRERNMIERGTHLLSHLNDPDNLSIFVQVDQNWLASAVASIAAEIDQPAIEPEILVESKPTRRVTVQAAQDGYALDTDDLSRRILESIETLTYPALELTVTELPPKTSPETVSETQARAEQLLSKRLKLTTTRNNTPMEWTLTDTELIGFVDFSEGYNRARLTRYLEGVAEAVQQAPENAKFNFDSSLARVVEFTPAKKGLRLNVAETSQALYDALQSLEQSSEVPPVTLVIEETDPDITLANSNSLGINTLLGRGFSTYKGSIPSRVHNVALAAKRINGTLVKPGATFSFNEAVGEIAANTGYQAAYVIRNGRTELGDGGGVCQDSTTVFRAAMDAGLPIVERRGHSYRVGYYEQNAKPGIDATVFSPTTDLKFLNDTPAHILVQTIVDEPNRALTVEIYGTSDGRKGEISNHTQWDSTPPPPDVYVDDPTLPTGTVKQVDWKAWGLKTKFDYTVRRDGAVIYEKTFYTTYKPWAAVFLRGVGP